MADITAALVKDLRDRTGLGMMECKKALVESDGDLEVAIETLRKKSAVSASKKAGRVAADGAVAVAISADKKSAVLVEINSETDFVARDDNFLKFTSLVADTALQNKVGSVSDLVQGDIETARQQLSQKIGEKIEVRRLENWSAEGDIYHYVHTNKRIGILVEITGGNAEVGTDLAMHIAASSPQVLRSDDVADDVLAKEKEIFLAQAQDSGKPVAVIEKMVEGRLEKFLKEVSLLNQPFVKDTGISVGQYCKQASANVVRFTRYEVGEGIEKQKVDFATEVQQAAKGN